MSKSFIVGAYASLPDERKHNDYYQILGQQDWIDGIEIPYPGVIKDNATAFAKVLPEHWTTNTITAIPGTMQNVWKEPHFGLASAEKSGREAALDFCEGIRRSVAELNTATGRNSISVIQLHSAPTKLADTDAFNTSLEQLLKWDWGGAEIVIEHCDKFISSQKPEKGFLAIEEEINIARQLGVGIHINWGRSVVEGRTAETAFEHIQQCAKAGVLAGVIFSGAGPDATQYGYEWIDGHLPSSTYEPTSLLTGEEIQRCAEAASSAKYIGAKICVPEKASLPERVQMLRNIYDSAKGIEK